MPKENGFRCSTTISELPTGLTDSAATVHKCDHLSMILRHHRTSIVAGATYLPQDSFHLVHPSFAIVPHSFKELVHVD
jgi:hypothetical protein